MTPERRVVPFKRWHYEWLVAREKPVEGGRVIALPESTLAELEGVSSWTGVVDGDPIACGGTIMQWPGRHVAWLYNGPMSAEHMLWLTREALRVIEAAKGRVEMTVREGFTEGHRWARLLGFRVETPLMEGYAADGAAHVGYVRFN